MSEQRDKMIKELKKWVVPELNKMGFKGSFPHYRRLDKDKLDLLMFQFNKYGGSFLVEISYVLPYANGKSKNLCSERFFTLPIDKLDVGCTNIRKRLKSRKYSDVWFYYYNLAEVKTLFHKWIIDVHPNDKEEFIKGHKGRIRWIQFVDDSIYETLAKEVNNCLGEAELWWSKIPKK